MTVESKIMRESISKSNLIHELICVSSVKSPSAIALKESSRKLDYQSLMSEINQASNLYLDIGIQRSDRVGVYL